MKPVSGFTSEQRDEIAALFWNCPELLAIANVEGRFTLTSPSWTATVGYTSEELCSKPYIEFVHPDDRDMTIRETKSLATPTYRTVFFENRYICKNGETIWLAWGAQNVGGVIYAIASDVTSVKRSLALYEEMEQQSRTGGWTLFLNPVRIVWTRQTWQIHELDPGTRLTREFTRSFYPPDEQERINKLIERCISNGAPFASDFRFITARGRHLWVKVTGEAERDVHGHIIAVKGTFQDISDRKALEVSLAEKVAQVSQLIQNVPGVVYQFLRDASGVYSFPFVSEKVSEIFELPVQEFIDDRQRMLKTVTKEDYPELERCIRESDVNLTPFEWRGRIQSGTGRIKWVLAKSTPHPLPDGSTLWDGILIDISKEKELEQELRKQREIASVSARMAAVGQLAAGVGHEINNPLTIAIGMIQKLERTLSALEIKNDVINQCLARHQEAVDRIARIVDGLRTLTRSINSEDQQGDLHRAVTSTVDLVREMFAREGVRIETSVGRLHAPIRVRASLGSLQQVVMNLLTNARDA